MRDGAFRTIASYAGVIGKKTPDESLIQNNMHFAEYLLRAVGVALIPYSEFGLAPQINKRR